MSRPACSPTILPRLPRSGDTVYGFVAGLYPTEYSALPGQDDGTGDGRPGLARTVTGRGTDARSVKMGLLF